MVHQMNNHIKIRRIKTNRLRTCVSALLFVVVASSVANACPTCKEAVSENGGNLVQGYFLSIMFMMSMPFIILTALSSMFYLDVRRARRRNAELAEAQLALGGSN